MNNWYCIIIVEWEMKDNLKVRLHPIAISSLLFSCSLYETFCKQNKNNDEIVITHQLY